jgi:antitoxin MazE
MTQLRNIGNSKGVLIPKALVEQADLEGHELELELCDEGLLIKPIKTPRANWEAQIHAELQAHEHDIDVEWLESNLSDDWEEE